MIRARIAAAARAFRDPIRPAGVEADETMKDAAAFTEALQVCREVLQGTHAKLDTLQRLVRCSFCSAQEREVRFLIAGPSAFICGECVEGCTRVIAERKARR